jgi:phosphate:Na+ symporter
VVIVLAAQGFLTLPAGIALAFGANIGTCVTAMLAALGKPREAVRAAFVHVLFNVLGVVVWVAFIDQLAGLVVSISPESAGLQGLDRLAAETPRQIANAHTLFNVVNTILFLPLAGVFVRVVERLIPELPPSDTDVVRPRYLDMELIRTPSLAADRARLEVLHMGERVRGMITEILPAVFQGTNEDLIGVKSRDEGVDLLHGRIISYLRRLSQENLSEPVSQELLSIMEAANDLEAVGDIIETNLVSQGLGRIKSGVSVSKETQEVLSTFHKTILTGLDLALQAVSQRSEAAARAVVEMKAEVRELVDSANLHEARRLVADEPNRLEAYTLEIDVLKNLERIYYFSKRMAKGVLTGLDR